MRKLLACLLAMALLFCFAGCADESATGTTGASTTTTTVATGSTAPATTTTEDSTTEVTESIKTTTTRSSSTKDVTTTVTTVKKTSQTTTTQRISTTVSTTTSTASASKDDWRTHPEDFKLIAFGFDDLPTSEFNTMMIIDTLVKYEGAGTCFVLGENVEKSGTTLLEYAVENGFEIGNHSYDHPNMKEITYDECMMQVRKTNDILSRKLGVTPKYFRPPYLATDGKLFSACFANGQMIVISGNKNSRTNTWYTVENDADTVKSCIENAYDGAIYVLHPARTDTAQGMEEICKTLYEQGYRFCTISELFEYKGVEPTFNKAYTDVYG